MNTADTSPAVVVLTGGIGSGKSEAENHFARLGVTVIDTDRLAREVVKPGTAALSAIADHFGSDILQADGSLDRRTLRRRVFESDEERLWLENLLHPLIRAEARREIRQHEAEPYLILAIPLLKDREGFDRIDRIVVVDVPESVQQSRAARRDGMSPEAIRHIIDSQIPRQQRLALADDILDNSGSREELARQVEQLHERYRKLFSRTQDH